jgi:hypothetical protein
VARRLSSNVKNDEFEKNTDSNGRRQRAFPFSQRVHDLAASEHDLSTWRLKVARDLLKKRIWMVRSDEISQDGTKEVD